MNAISTEFGVVDIEAEMRNLRRGLTWASALGTVFWAVTGLAVWGVL